MKRHWNLSAVVAAAAAAKKGTKVGEGEQSHGDGMERRKIKEANEIKGESFC